MRLFTALALPPQMLNRLDRLVTALRPEALFKWSPLDNLHITIKFIGEWPEAKLEALETALCGLQDRPPFPVQLRQLGFFPNRRAPRVFWLGVEAPDSLAKLAADTDRALVPLGVPSEPNAFTPHLTLARIKSAVPLQALERRIAGLEPVDLGAFTASRFILYRSYPGSNASVYRALREFPLAQAVRIAPGAAGASG